MFGSLSEMMILLAIGWVIWPGSFFLVAKIGESRVPPLWKNQSKAFLPGDLALPVMLIAAIEINASENLLVGPSTSTVGIIALAVIEIGLFYGASRFVVRDGNNYPERAANGPTKVYHDLVGYYLFPMSMAPQCVFYVASHIENGVGVSWNVLWVVLPLVFYIACVIYDSCKGFSAEDIEARHPADWQPIWETSATIQKWIADWKMLVERKRAESSRKTR